MYLLGVFHLATQNLTCLEILPSSKDWQSATTKGEWNAQWSVTVVWFNTQGTGKTSQNWGEEGNLPAKWEGPSVPPWIPLQYEYTLLPYCHLGALPHLPSTVTVVADDIFCGLPRPAMSIPYRLPWTPFLSHGNLWLNDQVISSCFVFWSKICEKNMALAGLKFETQHPHQVFSGIFWNYAPIWEGTSLKFLCKYIGVRSLRKCVVSLYISVSQHMASITPTSVQSLNPKPLF